jgi:hypothetical protein
MSRQRKRDAVLRLLRGEDLETVSRALGVTAATLTGWQEAFLAAGEASLATRPADGEELESGRLKAKLGEMLLERELLEAKIAILEGSAHRPAADPGERWQRSCQGTAGGRDDEPDRLARRRQGLRHGPGVPGLGHSQGDHLPASAGTSWQATAPPGPDRPDDRCGAGRGDPHRPRR